MSGSKFLAVAVSLVALTSWTVAYFHGYIGKPEMQSQIRKITSAEPAADVAAALAAGDRRFAAIGGMPMWFPGANGVAGTVFGWDCVAATQCTIWGPQQDRLIRVATEYAHKYNDALLPQLLVEEQQYLDDLKTILSDDPSRVQAFEADWERATQRLKHVYRQIDTMNLRYGDISRKRERLCWKLFLMRYRCWALEAELGMRVDLDGAMLFPIDLELSTRREILDKLAARLDAVLANGR